MPTDLTRYLLDVLSTLPVQPDQRKPEEEDPLRAAEKWQPDLQPLTSTLTDTLLRVAPPAPPATAPATPALQPQSQAFTPPGAQPTEPSLLEQAGRSFVAGWGDLQRTIGSAVRWLGYEEFGQRWERSGQELAERYQVEHPELSWRTLPRWLATTGVRSLPMTISLIPAALLGAYAGGGGAAALGLGAFGRMVLQAVGASALSRPLEAALEAGAVYDEALSRGMTPEEADRAADEVFRKNLALAGMDAAEFLTAFAPVPQPVQRALGRAGATALGRAAIGAGRVVGSAAPEAAEEYIQEWIQRSALGEPMQLDQQALEATVLGGLMGAGMGAVGTVYRTLRDRTIQKLQGTPAEERFQQAYLSALEAGLNPQDAELFALDAVANIPEGARAVTEAAQEVASEMQQQAQQATQPAEEPAASEQPEPPEAPATVPPAAPVGQPQAWPEPVLAPPVQPSAQPEPAQRPPVQPPTRPEPTQRPAAPPQSRPEPVPAPEAPPAPGAERTLRELSSEVVYDPWRPSETEEAVQPQAESQPAPVPAEPAETPAESEVFSAETLKPGDWIEVQIGRSKQLGRVIGAVLETKANSAKVTVVGREKPLQTPYSQIIRRVPQDEVDVMVAGRLPTSWQSIEDVEPSLLPGNLQATPSWTRVDNRIELDLAEDLPEFIVDYLHQAGFAFQPDAGVWIAQDTPQAEEAARRLAQEAEPLTASPAQPETPARVPRTFTGWHTPTAPQDEFLVQADGGAGYYIALDRPFETDRATGAPQRVQVQVENVFDPDGILDPRDREPHRRIFREMIDWINTQRPRSPRHMAELETQFLQQRGFDSRIRLIDGQEGNRELIVFDPSKVQPAGAPAAPAQPQTGQSRVQVTENEQRNGVEVRFTSKPSQEYIDRLKAAGFRWSGKQRLWYARRNEKTLNVAREIARELNTPGDVRPETPVRTETPTQEVSTGARPAAARPEVPAPEVGAPRPGALEGAQAEDVQAAEAEGAPSEGGIRSSTEDDGRAREPGGTGRGPDRSRGDGERAVRAPSERGGRAEPESEARPVEEPERRPARNLVIGPELAADLEPRGLKTKYRRNVAAIRLLKQLEAEGRPATPEEQAVLALFSGWGSLAEPVFGYGYRSEWQAEREEIRQLLTAEELEAARGSTLNAHYSSPLEIQTMWQAVLHMGFKGGRVLEPSAGVGHFIGLMPKELRGRTKVTAIELDSVTGRILRHLYPQSDVRIQGFEEADLPDGFYDLVISNVPFGNYGVHDPRYAGTGMTKRIHNYFFAKALDKVRPGGVVMFITSHGTMDSLDATHRQYIADRADLLLAVRLPNTAQEGAGTSVITDILVLRRRKPGDPPSGESWLNTVSVPIEPAEPGQAPRNIQINEYFARHPELVLGRHALIRGMYTADEYSVEPDGRDLAQALEAAFTRLPEDVLTPQKSAATDAKPVEILPPPGEVKFGGFFVRDGKVWQRHPKTGEPQQIKAAQVERIKSFIDLRDAVNTYMRLQLQDATDQAIRGARKRLNVVYDTFVKKYGALHAKENVRELGDDPDYLVVSALEEWDPKTKTAKKGEAFHKRTIQPIRAVEHVESAKDALAVTLNETGGVDLEHMMKLTGKSREEIIEELRGVIYEDPEDGWLLAEEYLSGNVREKLRIARAAAAVDERYRPNVEALERVQPPDIPAEDIIVSPASAWLPPDVIEEFFGHIFDVRPDNFSAAFNTVLGRWVVDRKRSIDKMFLNNANIRWGTNSRTAWQLLQDAISDRRPVIYDIKEDEEGNERRVINPKETALAREKLEEIKQEFVSWLWSDEERKNRLVRLYNDTMNNLRPWEPDGSHLTSFPGANPVAVAKLYPYQKNAIWRIIRSPRTLLAHVVGAGKTWEMVFSAMEMKRLGLIRKPVFVVMNHMAEQFANDIRFLYPNARVLVTTPQDVQQRNLAHFIAKAALGDWDAIVIRHASFTRIPVSPQVEATVIRDELQELERLAEVFREVQGQEQQYYWGRRRREKKADEQRFVKEIERRRKNLETRLKELENRAQHLKDAPHWEQIGADALFVDEYQEFRRLFYVTSKSRSGIKGLQDPKGSGRAFDLYMKIRSLEMQHGKRAPVVFATGTPVTNSMVELYTLMRYLDRDGLKTAGIEGFDAWASIFAQTVSGVEMTVAGQYKKVERLSKFINWPELIGRWRQFADVKTIDDLQGIIQRPKLVDGEYKLSVAEPSPELKRFMEDLLFEAEMGSFKDPAKMLKITTKGRLAAVDLRLVVPNAPDDPNSKLNRLVDNVYEIWERTKDKRSTQVIFADLGTPKGPSTPEEVATDTDEYAASDAETKEETQTRLIVYEDIKKKLVAKGVPPEEIAFIHDYPTQEKKQELFDAFNEGKIRILITSTRKAGVGTNMQRKLYALHNLDCPWYPADLEQRLGRILRPGNENPEVEVWNYATKYTFDEFLWQLIEAKGKMIYALLSGKADTRIVEDVAGELILNAIQMRSAVTGNQAAKELGEATLRLNELLALRSAFNRRRGELETSLQQTRERVKRLERRAKSIAQDIEARQSTQGDNFKMTLGDQVYTNRDEAQAALSKLVSQARSKRAEDQTLGEIGGFAIVYSYTTDKAHEDVRGTVNLIGPSGMDYPASATVQSLEANLRSLEDKQKRAEELLEAARKDVEAYEQQLAQKFQYDDEIDRLEKRIKELNQELGMEKEPEPDEDLIEGEEIEEEGEGLLGFPAEPTRPDYVIAKSPPKTEFKPYRLHPASRLAIIKEIENKLAVPIRQGRLTLRKAAGQYDERQQVIRARNIYNLRHTLHETGHHIANVLGLKPEKYAELTALGAELYPDESVWKQRQEGLAEFFVVWLRDEDQAYTVAPVFYTDFMKALDANPEVTQTLREVQRMYREYLGSSAAERIMGHIVHEVPKGRPFLTTKDQVYTHLADDLYPVFKAMQVLVGPDQVRSEWDVEIAKNPYVLARLARGRFRKAYVLLTRANMTPDGKEIGPSFAAILQPVRDNLLEFEGYLVARRMKELVGRGIDVGYTVEQIDAAIQELETPEFKTAAEQLYAYQDNLLDYLVDAGILTPKEKAAMQELNRYYVPFYRFMGDFAESGIMARSSNRYVDLPDPIKRIRGGDRPILSPLLSIMRNTIYFIDLAERNKAGRALADLADRAKGAGWLIEKLPTPMKPQKVHLERLRDDLIEAGIPEEILDEVDLDRLAVLFNPIEHVQLKEKRENIVTVWRNGKAVFYKLHPDLYKALHGLGEPAVGIAGKILSLPTEIKRAGSVLSPQFGLRNPLRDMLTAAMFSRYGFRPLVDTLRGLAHVLKKDEVYRQWEHSGGAQSTLVQLSQDYLERDLKKILGERTKAEKNLEIIRSPLTFLQMVSQALEEATRVAEFERAMEKGATRAEAGYASREVTLDFQRAGITGKQYNRVKAFFNAAVQGVDKLAREFKQRPGDMLVKSVLYIALPSLFLWLKNHDDPRYEELPRWQRDLNWVILTDDRIILIPKPFELGILFGTMVERFLDYVVEGDPKAFDELYDTITTSVLPGDPLNAYDWLPDVFLPWIEVLAGPGGWSSFLRRPIVPASEQSLLPEDQYGPRTSETAKIIGRAMDVSPRKVEHFIRGYGSTMAMHVLDFLDLLMGEATSKKTWPELIPGAQAFTTRPYQSSKSVDEFYDLLEQWETWYRSVRENYRRQGINPDAVISTPAQLSYLRRVRDQMAELRRLNRIVQESDQYTAEQKRQFSDNINRMITDLARQTLGRSPLPPPTQR